MSALHTLARGVALTMTLAACTPTPEGPPPPPPTQPKARDTPPPAYPIELGCADIGGQVVLSLTITTEGRTSNIRIDRSSKVAALDQAAAAAVKSWTFTPATSMGHPVERRIQVPVTFTPPEVRPEVCFSMKTAPTS